MRAKLAYYHSNKLDVKTSAHLVFLVAFLGRYFRGFRHVDIVANLCN